jgi:hypothetical protein
MDLERGKNPKLSRRTCSPRYGLQSCRGKTAGVAKRPRERSPTRNPHRHTIRNFFSSLYATIATPRLPPPQGTSWLLPLHSSVSQADQRRIFKVHFEHPFETPVEL